MASTIKVDTIQSTTSNVFFQNSAGTEYARFDTDGDLGIGITSPVVKLDVAGTTNIRHTYTGASGGILFGQYNITGDAQIQNQSSGGIIALATNNTERMRITPTGNVGIGTTNPLAKLNVVDGTYNCNMYIGYSGGGGTNYLQTNVATYFTNSTGATFHATVNPYGIGLGSATPTSGFGITFPATQSASADANTLDDYEEGTYTATITGSTTAGTQTYAGQAGRYTKVGNVVHVNVFVALNSATFTGAMKLSLPFTSVNDSSYGAGCIGYKNAWVTNGPNMFQVENNSSFGYVRRENAAGGTSVTDMAAANITTNTGFMVQVTYQVPS